MPIIWHHVHYVNYCRDVWLIRPIWMLVSSATLAISCELLKVLASYLMYWLATARWHDLFDIHFPPLFLRPVVASSGRSILFLSTHMILSGAREACWRTSRTIQGESTCLSLFPNPRPPTLSSIRTSCGEPRFTSFYTPQTPNLIIRPLSLMLHSHGSKTDDTLFKIVSCLVLEPNYYFW